ncbi:MAG: copper resistance protein CopC, partial [Microbacterium sp.]|nr:copper resistance protein CopC [Microbacterium sp.]
MVRGGGRRASLASAAAVAVLVLWQLLAVAAPASAHAVLVSSDPQDGSRVTSAPTRVTFTFDEAVQLPTDGTAAVSDKGGAAGRGAAMLGPGGHEVIVPLRADLPDGAYTVS